MIFFGLDSRGLLKMTKHKFNKDSTRLHKHNITVYSLNKRTVFGKTIIVGRFVCRSIHRLFVPIIKKSPPVVFNIL